MKILGILGIKAQVATVGASLAVCLPFFIQWLVSIVQNFIVVLPTKKEGKKTRCWSEAAYGVATSIVIFGFINESFIFYCKGSCLDFFLP